MHNALSPAPVQPAAPPPAEAPARDVSIAGFLTLAATSGVTIGMANIVTQLFAISIGATPFQMGVIGAMEAIGMMLLTIPAGFIIARHGAKVVYAIASLGPLAVYLLMPLFGQWWLVALARLAVGICIPFRTVSMASAFLGQLARIGQHKAGWYRASLTLGMAVLGPAAATFLTARASYHACYIIIAVLFGGMAAFSLSFFPEKEDDGPAGADKAGLFRQIGRLLRNPDVSECCSIEFVSGATASLFATFIFLVAASLPGLTARDAVNVLLIDGIVTITALFFGARALRHLSRRQAYAVSLGLAVAALLTVFSARGLPGLVVGGVLLSLASALVHLVNMVLLAGLPGERSKASSVYQLSQMLGSAGGALTGGFLSRVMPVQGLFGAWIAVLVVLAVPIWLFGRRSALLSPQPATHQGGH